MVTIVVLVYIIYISCCAGHVDTVVHVDKCDSLVGGVFVHLPQIFVIVSRDFAARRNIVGIECKVKVVVAIVPSAIAGFIVDGFERIDASIFQFFKS